MCEVVGASNLRCCSCGKVQDRYGYTCYFCLAELCEDKLLEPPVDDADYADGIAEAEAGWLRAAEAGTPDTWAEEDYHREMDLYKDSEYIARMGGTP